ncbi:hypothetical protein ACJ9FT_001282 [Klebsiella pneumoniae]|uniref:hypothetical protein n=1 Tax=Klebsiella pneumoniae TaxID=573 RepID=UPI000E2B945A|nr:hypothetical protein [Klebsiella pneumoniae]MDH8656876.1 hypothetical protein [Klebsiella pneumoniae]MDP0826587.1 hypothetical protein [Klebsiella pneumoniae]MEA1106552.1 hypothetical protein [Klebsiella pneumoniae]SVX90150.1 Uncharacterised protein [Klebsiella pneumoniae]SYP96059.1 Uncharacterised protein [Klebsiella pneumoniae]
MTTDITELTQEAARESGSILIIVAARMARREFFTPLHALCEAGKRVVSTRALRDAVEHAEERMVSQVPKIVDGHDRLTKKLKEAESRNAELVEALEKAQAQSSKWLEAYHKAVSIGARYEERIAELESRTVKLPKPISVLHRREFTAAHCAIYAYPEAEVNAALDGAGIKWEAE